MKNIFSKKTLALILTVLSICTALTGCAKNKIRHISLSEVDTPRIIYMLGEDLDLTCGAISVTYEKEEKTVFPEVVVYFHRNISWLCCVGQW